MSKQASGAGGVSGGSRGRRRRIVLWTLGGLLGVIVLLVALAPTVAGWIAPGIVAGAVNNSINGRATVGGMSLSWFGGQRVGPVTIVDGAGKQVANVTLTMSRGLLGLARAGLSGGDLGQMTVSGSASVIRRADGTVNASTLPKGAPGPTAPGAPAPTGAGTPSGTLPQGFKASVVLDKLSLEYTDERTGSAGVHRVTIPALSGVAAIDGGSASVDLAGEFQFQRTTTDAPAPGGGLTIRARLDGFADAAGVLTPDRARVDASVEAKDVAVAVADALAGMDNTLVAGIGEKLQASIIAKGTISDAAASILVSSRAVNIDLALKTDAGILTTSRPGTFALQGAGLMPMLPGLAAALSQGGMTLERLPDVKASLDHVRIPLPLNGKPLDLRGGSMAVSLETSETTGTVNVPQADGKPGPAQAMKIAPLKAALSSEDLSKKVSLTAGTSATIGGQSAGVLAVDLAAMDALDAAGKPRSGLPGRLAGSANLTGVATALAQPLLEKTGVELARDVGPRIDIVLRAETVDGAPGTPGDLPPTRLALDIKSANLNAMARVVAIGESIKSESPGVELKLGSAGALAGRMLKSAGVTVDSGLPVTVTVTNLAADLARLKGPKRDLRAISALVKIETGAVVGKLALAGQPAKSFELAPLLAMLDAKELTRGATLKAGTSAKLDGQAAGMLDVELAATGFLTVDGAAQWPALTGEATLDNVSTAIAQPFVESMGLNLSAGVGPKLAIAMKATSTGAGGRSATDGELTIKSAGLNSALAFTLDGRTIRKRGADAVLSLRSPGTLAGKAATDAGIALSEGGYARATLKDFAIELDEQWSPRLDRSAVDIELNIGGFWVAKATGLAEQVALGQIITNVKLAPAAAPTLALRGSGKHQGADFFMQGAFELVGVIGKDATGKVALTPANVRPLGNLELNNIPTSLASLAIGPPAVAKAGDKPGLDLARLIRDAVGPTATIKLAAAKPSGGSAEARAVTFTLAAPRFSGSAAGAIDDKALSLSTLDFKGQVTPELAASLIDTLGGGLDSKPTLVSPATLTIAATPFTIPLAKGGAPQLAGAGDASFKIGLEGKALVKNVIVKAADGTSRDLGTVGLENVLLTANIPLSSLAPGSAPKPAHILLTAGVLGAANKRILDLEGEGKVNLASGSPQGDLNAGLTLSVLDAAWLDTFLGKPGLLAQGLGPTAVVDAAAVVQFPKAAPAPGATAANAFERATLTASIKSAHLAMVQPLKATALPDGVSIDVPMVVKWTMQPGWGNTYALAPSKPGEAPVAQFTTPTELTVSLFKLGLATGPDTLPFKPGVFVADVQIDSPGTTLVAGSGKSAVPAALKNFRARLTGGKDPGTLGFSLSLDDAGGGMAPGGKPAVAFSGGVYGISDSLGKPTPDAAKITMTGTAVAISTVIVDALAHQGGLLTEALGPKVNLDVKAEGLSMAGGNLTVVAVSPRAEARLPGSIRNGAFAISSPGAGKPAQIAKILEATPKLGSMLVQGLPVLGTFEKRPADGPAIVNAYAMTIPIDGDMRKLNGRLVVDLGVARFATSDAFKALLKVTRQKDTGTIGRRMEPFGVDFKDGVGTYEKFMIPLGEFRLATSGTIDLVNKQMDVVTYIPFGALADEAAGMLNTGLGKLLTGAVPVVEQATMVPIRTRGSFAHPDTKPDLELFGKEFIKNIRPDRLIKDIFKK